MEKKLFGAVLALLTVLSLLPTAAIAASNGAYQISDDTTGSYVLTPYRTDSAWRLPPTDSNRSEFSVFTENWDGLTVNIYYTGAQTGTNEYLSAVIMDSDGRVCYYDKLRQLADIDDESGSVAIDLSYVAVPSDSKLYLFNEQCSGDHQTVCASELKEVDLPIFPGEIDPDGYIFPSLEVGYGQLPEKAFSIGNRSNDTITGLSVELSGERPDCFTLSFLLNRTTLSGGQSFSFLICPKARLKAGNYSATIIIRADGMVAVAKEISFTVTAPADDTAATDSGTATLFDGSTGTGTAKTVSPISGLTLTVGSETVETIAGANPGAPLTIRAERVAIGNLKTKLGVPFGTQVETAVTVRHTATAATSPQIFDLNLLVGGTPYTNSFASPIRVSVTTGAPAPGNRLALFYLPENASPVRLSGVTYTPVDAYAGTLSASLTHCSIYAVVEEPIPSGGNDSSTGTLQAPKTADAGLFLYTGMALSSAAGAVYIARKVRRV